LFEFPGKPMIGAVHAGAGRLLWRAGDFRFMAIYTTSYHHQNRRHMHMKNVGIALLVVLLTVLTAPQFASRAAQTPSNEVAVTLTEYKVTLSTDNVEAGRPITFVITNAGTMVHEAVLEPASARDEPLEVNGQEEELEDIAPGTTHRVVWTIPKGGAYKISCYIDNHYELGMHTEFTALTIGEEAVGMPSTGAPLPGWLFAGLLVLAACGIVGLGLRLARRGV
jgi:uncharacterized cupredoxin-like copper-binding protein